MAPLQREERRRLEAAKDLRRRHCRRLQSTPTSKRRGGRGGAGRGGAGRGGAGRGGAGRGQHWACGARRYIQQRRTNGWMDGGRRSAHADRTGHRGPVRVSAQAVWRGTRGVVVSRLMVLSGTMSTQGGLEAAPAESRAVSPSMQPDVFVCNSSLCPDGTVTSTCSRVHSDGETRKQINKQTNKSQRLLIDDSAVRLREARYTEHARTPARPHADGPFMSVQASPRDT